MSDTDILEILKADLEIMGSHKDKYLTHLIAVAREEIATEGIQLTDSVLDGSLVERYAAYLYRKRSAQTGSSGQGGTDGTAMPRSLRYSLNNRLMKQKRKVNTDVT